MSIGNGIGLSRLRSGQLPTAGWGGLQVTPLILTTLAAAPNGSGSKLKVTFFDVFSELTVDVALVFFKIPPTDEGGLAETSSPDGRPLYVAGAWPIIVAGPLVMPFIRSSPLREAPGVAGDHLQHRVVGMRTLANAPMSLHLFKIEELIIHIALRLFVIVKGLAVPLIV